MRQTIQKKTNMKITNYGQNAVDLLNGSLEKVQILRSKANIEL